MDVIYGKQFGPLAFTSDLPKIDDIKNRVYDIDGKLIEAQALVETVEPIPTGAKGRKFVPQGECLTVIAKSGAAFLLEDVDGYRHIAAGKRLRVIVPGNANDVTTLDISATGVVLSPGYLNSAKRGAEAAKKANKTMKEKKQGRWA